VSALKSPIELVFVLLSNRQLIHDTMYLFLVCVGRPSHLKISGGQKWPVPQYVGGPYTGHVR